MVEKINILEAASELASQRVVDDINHTYLQLHKYKPSKEILEGLLYIRQDNGDIVYRDHIQEVFNNYYDMFEDILLKCKEA